MIQEGRAGRLSLSALQRRLVNSAAATPLHHYAIKPLDWLYDKHHDSWSAKTVFGQYKLSWSKQWRVTFYGPTPEHVANERELSAAKQAAQADYEHKLVKILLTPRNDI